MGVKILQVFELKDKQTPFGLGDDNKIYMYIATEQKWYLWGMQ